MLEPTYLKGQFLLSMPHLKDGVFDGTLTYICDHNENGALGVVINQPMELPMDELFDSLEINPIAESEAKFQPVYRGGPVSVDHGFVLHTRSHESLKSSMQVDDETWLTTSTDILQQIAEGYAPENWMVLLGYAGWGPGQLDSEMSDNVWLSCPANLDIIFRVPAEERLSAAAESLGINLDLLTSQSGHA